MTSRGAAQPRLVPKSSVHRALNALGDRWSLLVIQEAFLGATRFKDFHDRLGGARSTLSSRLQALERQSVLERRPFLEDGTRMSYHLTPRGLAIFDCMILMWGWGVRWGVGDGASPTLFVHDACGRAMLPELRCTECHEPLTLHSCSFTRGPGAGTEKVPVQRMHRRRQPADEAPTLELVDLIGDRWTALVVSAQYFGAHRFDAIQALLGIASNILSDRLRMLETAGIFERQLYEITPPRYEYRLTRKGMDLYPHALAMMIWAEKWLRPRAEQPVLIRHRCGAALSAEVDCSVCRGALTMQNVQIRNARPRAPD